MERAPKPRKILSGLDKWSNWLLIAMFVVGIALILVDAVLIVGLWGQSPGSVLARWFAKPTPTTVPAIQISPAEGMPGVTVAVAGQGWKVAESLVLQLSDPTGTCPQESVRTTTTGPEGRFRDEFVFPPDGCWAGVERVLLIVRSIGTGSEATAAFRVLAIPQTPTPTVPWTPVPLTTATPSVEPTVVEPTATATPTPTVVIPTVVVPTSTATPVPSPTPAPTVEIVNWRGEYFDNPNLMGPPVFVRDDTAINFDWQNNAPALGLIPVDGFSARWTRVVYFEDGLYRFQAIVDDGIRLYVDGDLVLDQWRDGGRREAALNWPMKVGWHTLRVEYYERSGAAVAQVRWDKVVTYPQWKGEYWSNLNLQGNPALVRNETGPNGTLGLDLNWGQGGPGGVIPADGFSARWTRTAAFDAGTYRFDVLVDDGVRLWVNDRLVMDAWSDHNAQQLMADWTLAQGTYTIKVEYYERIGNARLRVQWYRVQDPTYADWKGEYWPNRSLSGDMVLVRNDRGPNGTPGIDFDWGSGAPFSGLPADNFSARWTRQAEFDATTYRFHVLADDGVRLWVDGQLLIDKWQDQHPTEYTADRTLVRGRHALRVEYYEGTGGARIKVWWVKVETSYPDWKGEYWSNRDLSGNPSLVRNDKGTSSPPGIDFSWGSGAPAAGLPSDNLSARWTRQVALPAGIYRFYAWADDGVRLAVNGQWIINEWHDARDKVYSADLPLQEAKHQVKVEYYERGGTAAVRFWWQRLGDLPTPVPAPKVKFGAATYTVDEGAGTATINVLLSAASDRKVTVDYATSGGTATPGSDYGPLGGKLTFDPGVTSRTLTVSIVDDSVDEPDETVVLALSSPANAQLGAIYQAVLTIVDNDLPAPPPDVRFSAPTYSVAEGAGSATITVLLSAPSSRTVTVDYVTGAGSASAGSDYLAAEGTLTFLPGVTSQMFSVSIVDDTLDEPDETVALSLRNAVQAQLGAPQNAALIIVDNDEPAPPPEVRFDSVTYSVGEGAGTATITVVLSAESVRTVSVDYVASGGTADVGTDYGAAQGTLTFDPGVSSRTFSVTIIDDGLDEEDETVGLTLSSPTNAVLGTPSQAVLAIIDNDTTPAALPGVQLNEILSVPVEIDWDQDGTANELDEWIELYNAGTSAVDLGGWTLGAEKGSAPYLIPISVTLKPGAFLVLYRQETGIALADGGDTVRLLETSGQLVDAVTFGPLDPDSSYNRSEAGDWHTSWLPTPGAPNVLPTTITGRIAGRARVPAPSTPAPKPTRSGG